MNGATEASAAARVFAIPELLENILSYLVDPYTKKANNVDACAKGIRALFRLQMVNRAFRDVISRSTALRRSMFVDSAVAETEKLELVPFNPLLDCIGTLSGLNGVRGWWYGCDDEDGYPGPAEYQNDDADVPTYDNLDRGVLKSSSLELVVNADRYVGATSSMGSWRKTVVSNGTSKVNVRLSVVWKGSGEGGFISESSHELWEGITLGELADKITKITEELLGTEGSFDSLT